MRFQMKKLEQKVHFGYVSELSDKLWILSNEIPEFNLNDQALLERLLFIPFNYNFSKYSSKNDKEKLNEFMKEHHDKKIDIPNSLETTRRN